MFDQTAIPTEYKGIRFRSKSEACFAKYLDYCQEGMRLYLPFFWEYEPEQLRLECGYVPDFRLVFNARQKIWCELIEYKPVIPTNPAADRVFEKLNILSNSVAMDCIPRILCGSFWNNSDAAKPRTITSVCGRVSISHSWFCSNSDEWSIRQQIARTRFDLVNPESYSKGTRNG